MSDDCCPVPTPSADPRYRRILWIALAVNAAMFLVELGASATSGSAALAADAVDFAGDASNYGLSLAAVAAGGFYVSVPSAIGFIAVFGVAMLNGIVLVSFIHGTHSSRPARGTSISMSGA